MGCLPVWRCNMHRTAPRDNTSSFGSLERSSIMRVWGTAKPRGRFRSIPLLARVRSRRKQSQIHSVCKYESNESGIYTVRADTRVRGYCMYTVRKLPLRGEQIIVSCCPRCLKNAAHYLWHIIHRHNYNVTSFRTREQMSFGASLIA